MEVLRSNQKNGHVRIEVNSNKNTTKRDLSNKKTNNIALKVLAGVAAGAAALCTVGAITTGLVVPLYIAAGICGLVSLISLSILHKKTLIGIHIAKSKIT